MTKKEFFDGVAESHDPLLFTDADRQKMEGLRNRLGDLTGLRVLEPGCGVGPLAEYLCEWVGPTGRVLAFDASPRMVEQARRRLGRVPNVELACAEAETIRLEPSAWDRVILFRVFPHFEDKAGLLRRFRACLAPGGRLVIANLEGSARLNSLHAGFSEPVRHDRMPSAEELRRLFDACGCTVAVAVDSDDEFYVEARPRVAVLPAGYS